MEGGQTGLYNVGSGEELSIRSLAELIARIVGFRGKLEWDASRPDGTPRKLLDSSRARATGWSPQITLEEGIQTTYQWYRESSSAYSAAAS
jgi:GDP-L-fucose synthase